MNNIKQEQLSVSDSKTISVKATYAKATITTGIDTFFAQLQTALNQQILNNTKLPLIADRLKNAQQIIDNFRDDINVELNKLPNNATAIQLETALLNALKPLNLLKDLDGNKLIDLNDIKAVETANGVSFELNIGQALSSLASATGLNLATDLPGLGLDVQGNVNTQLGFDLKLKFGLNSQGFFVDTASANELKLDVKANTTLTKAQGKLGPLAIEVKDIQGKPTGFDGSFSIELKGGSDNLLTGSELSSINLDASLSGKASINLNTKTSFNNSTVLPSLAANVNVDWNFNNVNADSDRLGTFGTPPTVAFNNVSLEAGTFFKFAWPILDKIQKAYEPIKPVIDILTKKIDLQAFSFTPLDVARRLGYIDAEDKKFVEAIAKIGNLANTIKSGANNVWIEQGSYGLGGNFNIYNTGSLTGATPTVISTANLSSNTNAQVNSFIQQTKDLSGLSFPLFANGLSSLSLLLGKKDPIDLFNYDMPNLSFNVPYEQFFPILGPLGASIKGRFGVDVDLGFGFDTKGLDFANTSNFDGFYLNDLNSSGKDINELTLRASLKAFAAIDAGLAAAGVGGGIVGLANLNLKDKNKDGKIRASELNFSSPLCMFDMSGQLKAELSAYYRVGYGWFSYRKEFNGPSFTILDFNYTPKCSSAPRPILGSKTGNKLIANTGPKAVNQVTGIQPPPPPPKRGVISFSTDNYSVNENGTAILAVRLTRTNGSDGAVSVTLTPSNGTATAPSDYSNAPITVNFANGETSKTVNIPIVNDSLVENNETVNLTLSNPTGGATLGSQKSSVLTIVNDDVDPVGTLAFSNAFFETEEISSRPVKITRTGGSKGAVTVVVTPSNGTALAPGDYDNSPITVSFANGETSKSISIPTVRDNLIEGKETIFLELSSPTGGATLGSQKTATLNVADNTLFPGHIAWVGPGTSGDDLGNIIYLHDGSFSLDNTETDGRLEASKIGETDSDIAEVAISGNNTVWSDYSNIYTYDDTTGATIVFNISNTDVGISGNNIVWESDSGIYLYQEGEVLQLTDDSSSFHPAISGNNIVWGSDSGIYLYQDGEVLQLTDDSSSFNAAISGNNIVWDSNSGIYMYNQGTVNQITQNKDSSEPEISGNTVVWEESGDIYMFNEGDITQLTNDESNSNPAISGDYVAYESWDGNDQEIYLYNINSKETIRVTNNNVRDYNVRISIDDTSAIFENKTNSTTLSKKSNTTQFDANLSQKVENPLPTLPTPQPLTNQTKDTDDTLATATIITTLAGSEAYSDTLGQNDQRDFYRVEVKEPTTLKLLVNGMTENVNLNLLDSNGAVLSSSTQADTAAEYVTYPVNPGIYYISVVAGTGITDTPYNLIVTTDQDEYFKVTRKGSDAQGETLTLTAFNFDENGQPFDKDGTNPLSQDFSGIKTIEADGGLGNDIFDIASGITSPANLTGGEGNDRITSADGKDTLSGGTGLDVINGGKEADQIQGNDDDDLLIGGLGNDTIDGGAGLDTASYSTSNQAVRVNLQNNTLSGGDAQGDVLTSIENLEGSAFADSLTGNTDNNALNGNNGTDTLDGGSGNDLLIGGGGADVLNGGDGSDTAFYATSSAGVTVNLGNPTATTGSDATGDKLNSIENLAGSPFNDRLTGDSTNNNIEGDLGNDTLDGGLGNDTLSGGGGNDTYFIDSLSDQLKEPEKDNQSDSSGTIAKGIDTVQSSVSYTLGTNLENLILTGTTAITASGNASDNLLSGNGQNNTIFGLAGNDTLFGSGGDNILNGGSGKNTYTFNNNTTTLRSDTITSDATAVDTILLSSLVTPDTKLDLNFTTPQTINSTQKISVSSGTVIENVIASSGNDSLVGNSQANFMAGNAGNDTIIAGAGDDTLQGNGGNNRLDGGLGNNSYICDLDNNVANNIITSPAGAIDQVVFSANVNNATFNLNLNTSQTVAPNVTVTIASGTTIENVRGGNGNDLIIGNSLANDLNGFGGSDTLTGGAGGDRFTYFTETVFSNINVEIDTITDFTKGSDKIVLSKTTFDQLNSSIGNQLNATDFATVTSDAAAATVTARIVYNTTNGNLFYNQNGNLPDLGNGAQLATLSNKPSLAITDFSVIA